MPYIVEIIRLGELAIDLLYAATSGVPHGDRMDKLTGIVQEIQQTMHAAQVAFDTELPHLPKR